MSGNRLDLDRLMEILRERGFTLKLRADGTPAIRGPVAGATPALLRVLAMHREPLIERLRRKVGPIV